MPSGPLLVAHSAPSGLAGRPFPKAPPCEKKVRMKPLHASLRRRSSVIALATAVLALLAACNDGEEPPAAPSPAATVVAASPTPPTPAPPGPTTFRVLAGATEGAVDIEQFMPATVRIREGDTISWTVHGYESHTVTFVPAGRLDVFGAYLSPAPDEPGAVEFNHSLTLASEAHGSYDGTQLVNSGFVGVPNPAEYSLTFPTAGVYT